MSPHPLPSFHELRSGLLDAYPLAFSDSAYLLWLILDGRPPMGLSPGSSPWLAPLALEKLALRGQLQRPAVPPAEVLVTHYPGRADYAPFLAPIVAELGRRGRSVAVALPPRSTALLEAYGPTPAFELHALAGAGPYARARAAFAAHGRGLNAFSAQHGLSARRRSYVSIVLQAYFWQSELFRLALRRTGARVVLGLHFMLHPGMRGAIREAGVRTFFIQHGVFSRDWPTHDFHGADRVLLWSDESAAELRAFPQPLPDAVVTGSPKLEWLRTQRQKAAGEQDAPAGVPRVLVLGTNGEGERDMRALRLAASALGEMSAARVTVRPHPAEPAERYRALVSEGLLRPEQLDHQPDVHASLRTASVVVGTQSTLLLEAVALGVPAVQLLPELLELNWAARGMPAASTASDLRALIEKLLSDPQASSAALTAARPIAESSFGRVEGAAARAADAVEGALGTEPRAEAGGAKRATVRA